MKSDIMVLMARDTMYYNIYTSKFGVKLKCFMKENLIVIKNHNVLMNKLSYEYKLPVAFINNLLKIE